MLYWNDTVLVLDVNVGLQEQEVNEKFRVKAYPNPVVDEASLKVVIPEEGKVDVIISSIHGRLIQAKSYHLSPGMHEFSFIPGGEAMYFISFSWQGHKRYLKLINASPQKGRESFLSYVGGNDQIEEMKSSARSDFFEFTLGDQLLYVGYIDTLESGITDVPLESEIYTFQFAYNIPCIGTPTVEYEGQVYETVQIFSQCWLKENLNVGQMITGDHDMEDNEIIERYCFLDFEDSCNVYGGLYQWDEMMQYTTQEGAKGICPDGWHIPTDEEWKVLEGASDSYYGIGHFVWDNNEFRGFDAGKNLKSKSGWMENGNGIDLFGFASLPAGNLNWNWTFTALHFSSSYWTSTDYFDPGWSTHHSFIYNQNTSSRYIYYKYIGFSVRCVKD